MFSVLTSQLQSITDVYLYYDNVMTDGKKIYGGREPAAIS